MPSLGRCESSRQSEAVEVEEPSCSITTSRLQNELEDITINSPPNIFAYLKGDNLFEWKASIEGPRESPYEGGLFLLDITFPSCYPFEPPKITFINKVYHCNINSRGEINLDILHQNWVPSLTVSSVLLSIQSLLADCNPKDSLVPEIAEKYVNNREEHDKICREWTKKYANKKDVIRNFFMV